MAGEIETPDVIERALEKALRGVAAEGEIGLLWKSMENLSPEHQGLIIELLPSAIEAADSKARGYLDDWRCRIQLEGSRIMAELFELVGDFRVPEDSQLRIIDIGAENGWLYYVLKASEGGATETVTERARDRIRHAFEHALKDALGYENPNDQVRGLIELPGIPKHLQITAIDALASKGDTVSLALLLIGTPMSKGLSVETQMAVETSLVRAVAAGGSIDPLFMEGIPDHLHSSAVEAAARKGRCEEIFDVCRGFSNRKPSETAMDKAREMLPQAIERAAENGYFFQVFEIIKNHDAAVAKQWQHDKHRLEPLAKKARELLPSAIKNAPFERLKKAILPLGHSRTQMIMLLAEEISERGHLKELLLAKNWHHNNKAVADRIGQLIPLAVERAAEKGGLGELIDAIDGSSSSLPEPARQKAAGLLKDAAEVAGEEGLEKLSLNQLTSLRRHWQRNLIGKDGLRLDDTVRKPRPERPKETGKPTKHKV